MIFKLVRNDEKFVQGKILGYEWIEVLAFIPMTIRHNDNTESQGIHNWAVCRTEDGLTRIGEDDLFAAIEEEKEYIEAKEKPSP